MHVGQPDNCEATAEHHLKIEVIFSAKRYFRLSCLVVKMLSCMTLGKFQVYSSKIRLYYLLPLIIKVSQDLQERIQHPGR